MHVWKRSWLALLLVILGLPLAAAQDGPATEDDPAADAPAENEAAPGKPVDNPSPGASGEPRERLAPMQDATEKLVLPENGRVVDGCGQLVIVPDDQEKPVVGRLHCQVGERSLVILPSGKIKSVPSTQVTITERPFKPAKAEALAAGLQAGRFKDFKTEISDHYVYVYRCDEHLYKTTRNILESLHDGIIETLKAWKIAYTPLEVPLVVLIFPDRKSFDAYSKMPENMLAYYDGQTNYIVLYQDPELSDAAPELALKQAAYTIAHEGVHQLLSNLGVQKRLAPWPAWICEGLPETFCPVKVSSKMVKQGGASMPSRDVRWTKLGMVNDLRMWDLLKAPTTGGQAVKTIIGGERLTSRGYALAWGLTHYLAHKRKSDYRKYLQDVAAIEPLAGYPSRRVKVNEALFVKHFGNDFATIEKDLAAYLTSKQMQDLYHDPFIYQTHYVVVHNARRGKANLVTVMITTSPDGARQWKDSEERASIYTEGQIKHAFNTHVCETRHAAEAVVAKIGGKK